MNDLTKKLFDLIQSGSVEEFVLLYNASECMRQSDNKFLTPNVIQFDMRFTFDDYRASWDEKILTPLAYAARLGKLAWVKQLLSFSDLESQQFAIIEAVKQRNLDVLNYLLEQDICLDFDLQDPKFKLARCYDHLAPVSIAIEEKESEILNLLIVNGAEIKKQDFEKTLKNNYKQMINEKSRNNDNVFNIKKNKDFDLTLYQVTKWGYCLTKAKAHHALIADGKNVSSVESIKAKKYLSQALNKVSEKTVAWLARQCEKITLNNENVDVKFIKFAASVIHDMLKNEMGLSEKFHDTVTLKLTAIDPNKKNTFFANEDDRKQYFKSQHWSPLLHAQKKFDKALFINKNNASMRPKTRH